MDYHESAEGVTTIKRWIEAEIDLCLAYRIQAEKLGQTTMARLHNNRIVQLLMRKETLA